VSRDQPPPGSGLVAAGQAAGLDSAFLKDALECGHCGGRMEIVAALTSKAAIVLVGPRWDGSVL
jgi:hypothetical protein